MRKVITFADGSASYCLVIVDNNFVVLQNPASGLELQSPAEIILQGRAVRGATKDIVQIVWPEMPFRLPPEPPLMSLIHAALRWGGCTSDPCTDESPELCQPTPDLPHTRQN